jgi:hypothetical protein
MQILPLAIGWFTGPEWKRIAAVTEIKGIKSQN